MGSHSFPNISSRVQRDRYSDLVFSEAHVPAGAHFLTIHNVQYQLNLMSQARKAIKEDRYPQFVKDFFHTLYQGDSSRYPQWAVVALKTVGIDLQEK